MDFNSTPDAKLSATMTAALNLCLVLESKHRTLDIGENVRSNTAHALYRRGLLQMNGHGHCWLTPKGREVVETPSPVKTTPVETTPVNFHLRRLADWDFTKRAPKLKPATTPATLPLSADTVRLKTPAKWTAPWRAAYSLAWVAGENSIKIDSLTGVIGSGFIVLIAPPVVIIDGLIADGWTVEPSPVKTTRRADIDAKLETLKAIVEGLAWTAGGEVAAFLLRSGYVTKGTHGTLNPTRRGRRVVERQWPKLEARRASEPPAPLKLQLSKPKSRKARHAAEAINKAARDVGVDLDGREVAASFAELDGSIILIKPPRRLVDVLVADGWTKQGLS